MPLARATHLTARVRRWFAVSITGRLLHIFENSCSLINEEGDVITVANPGIGAGPFTVLLEADFDFQEYLHVTDSIGAGEDLLRVGPLQVDLSRAQTWDAVPAWRSVSPAFLAPLARMARDVLAASEIAPGIAFEPPPDPSDAAAVARYARALAGLGPGLTPSGDDVLVGLIHAYWVRFDAGTAGTYARQIAAVAGPRTASLSDALLGAAAEGEAGEPWHALVRAAAAKDPTAVHRAAEEILAVGHTSGADALAGFAAGLLSG